MTFASAVDVSKGIDVGKLLRDVIENHHVKHSSVWRDCDTDGGQFSRALVGLAPLDLWHLRGMDARIFVDFLTALAIAVVNKNFNEIQLPLLRMAKAQLPESDRKEKAS